jgi:hypothetical protein
MSSTFVEYSEMIHIAQEHTREDLIWGKASSRRVRMVSRSFGFVSMISRTKKTCATPT